MKNKLIFIIATILYIIALCIIFKYLTISEIELAISATLMYAITLLIQSKEG